MLNEPMFPGRPAPLDRLSGSRAGAGALASIDWDTPIDRMRWFFCETLTPLYYTAVYHTLGPEHRLRYNQLTGMLSNELILFLETGFLEGVLQAVARNGRHDDLFAVVRGFHDDERRHAEAWRRLNRLSAPDWYAKADRHLVQVPRAIQMLSRFAAHHPFAFPVVFWIQLVQEERSVDISRRCVRLPAGRLEPRYGAVYRAHLQDEVRHVQIDWHLIDRFYAAQSAAARRLTAALFRLAVGVLFLKPVHSTLRVIQVLVSEHPELRPLVPRMRRELRSLSNNEDYQQMMYSRRTTPVTFGLFDRFWEFRRMDRVLRAYEPPAVQWRQL